ncbi:MAG TPA: DoxX family protein [Opitutaceae bacterium]|nr:DoxX family protein [Opitutaceae bacterium]
MKLLHLDFLPRSGDLGLLVLRLTFGAGLLYLHGWGKLTDFGNLRLKFPDPLGVGSMPSLTLAVFAEVICAGLIVLGAYTRLAALAGAITMGVAFFLVHGGKLSGPGSGELACAYLAAFAALFVAGAGRYSLDAKLGAKI